MPNNSYFQGNPTRLDVSRSHMTTAPRWTGTWNTGYLVPILAKEVLPGDTFKVDVSSAVRMSTPLFPTMDDMEITVEAYFVPNRLILHRKSMSPSVNDSNESWDAFIGAQDSLLNMPTPADVQLPYFEIQTGGSGYTVGGLADCLGLPDPKLSGNSYRVNCLKGLAYYSVWNDYWREPNTVSAVTFQVSSGRCIPAGPLESGIAPGAGVPFSYMDLANVSRYHGYFGSALPWPQRNSTQVTMPLGDKAPIITGANHVLGSGTISALNWADASDASGSTPVQVGALFAGLTGTTTRQGSFPVLTGSAVPKNLWADLSTATSATVNAFRLAVQTQRWYEALARSGNKYADMIDGMFGVRGPSVTNRAEYLGGFVRPINLSQVADTASNLGATGAYSLSNPGGFLFSKSFTEHGYVMVVACCRVRESFSQGLDRDNTRFDRFDFYWPQFANLGEQPILVKEACVTGSSYDDEVFGYQEAWAEYRMDNDHVTGYASPNNSSSLSFLTYANLFDTSGIGATPPYGPVTLKGYLDARNQADIVDRTLKVSHGTAGFQFFGQFQFHIDMIRPMPLYSIPGLVDHH